MADRVSKGEVIAFRLGAHHLTERLGEGGLLDAAGRCGIQNSPPGLALLALHARVRNLTQEQVTDALAKEKSLLQTWCMRGSPFYFPASDAPVFTTGVLPTTEEAMRHFVPGVEQALDKLGMNLVETVELTGAEIGDVLSGGRLAINPLGAEIATRIARTLPKRQRDNATSGRMKVPTPRGNRSGRVSYISASASSRCGAWSASRRAPGTQHRSSWSPSGLAIRSRTSPRSSRAPNCFAVTCAATVGRHEETLPRGRGPMPVTPTLGGGWLRTS